MKKPTSRVNKQVNKNIAPMTETISRATSNRL